MCGITGFLSSSTSADEHEMIAVVEHMAETLHHRGPDDRGSWADPQAGIALGHRRLSIIDLSPNGRQPMQSANGRYTIIYNGEIYNHHDLRNQLEQLGVGFRGHSDTEVLLEAISQWGLVEAVGRCVGMFALAVWDSDERRLALVRDRLGIKPLYYGRQGKTFMFGSELKSLRAHPDFQGEIHRDAIGLFVRHNYIPAPFSIYRNIYKLEPGTILYIQSGDDDRHDQSTIYWSAREVVAQGEEHPFDGSPDDAVQALDKLLRDAVHCRMYADVDLGAFLSGGIDSSTVVALMQAQSTRPVRTFSIGFQEAGYNEALDARAVAKHLGTEHVDWYVSPEDARNVIPRLATMYDEPFADSSQIPTFLVSQLARRHVTVSLSGDGGDELFAGYNRYFSTQHRWRMIGWCPLALRRSVSHVLRSIASWQPSRLLARKMRGLAYQLAVLNPAGVYDHAINHWKSPNDLVINAAAAQTVLGDYAQWHARRSLLEKMMFVDSITYLPDDILVKVDRASMAVSLEARVPILDHRVVEFAWTLAPNLKVRGGQSKWLLRQVLDRYVPRQLIDRPKTGFGLPIDVWLRGPLRDWAEQLLDARRLADEGFFRAQPIRQKWDEHLSGKTAWHFHLWDILMFQAWLENERVTP